MQRIKWGLLWWLLLSIASCLQEKACCHSGRGTTKESGLGDSMSPEKGPVNGWKNPTTPNCNKQPNKQEHGRKHGMKGPKREGCCKRKLKAGKVEVWKARRCMEDMYYILQEGNLTETIQAFETLEEVLQETDVNDTITMSVGNLIAHLHKPRGPFQGLEISASEKETMSDKAVPNSKVRVRLPKALKPGLNNTIVFCMLNVTEKALGTSAEMYEQRLIGLSVQGKKVSGLQEPIEITINVTTTIKKNHTPSCQFFDFSTGEFNKSGCETKWHRDQGYINCSCNHLTYFGVLMVPFSSNISEEDQQILTYITLIGCSLSFLGLVITVLLFITNRKLQADVSMKVHINLAIALILLNMHFLPSQWVAALPSTGPCLYVGLALHYSLLATFSWMAIEGFHLYLLLVRVFNIYVRRYLLKLSVVGWGVPVVIVSLVLIVDRDAYGRVPMDSSNSNATAICYITSDTVKMVTTVGVYCLVFLFNLVMFGVTVKRVVMLHHAKEYGQNDREKTKRGICTLLGVTILLGITWGLVFFSFGYLTTPGLYLFCILNSLQGFFLFLWFIMSLRKTGNSGAKSSSETRSSNG